MAKGAGCELQHKPIIRRLMAGKRIASLHFLGFGLSQNLAPCRSEPQASGKQERSLTPFEGG
jgi:hypothetical protein